MASFFYLLVKSESWTAPSCVTLPLAKHCHPSFFQSKYKLCFSFPSWNHKSTRKNFMHFNFQKSMKICWLSTFQSLLGVIDGRGQDPCFHYCHKWFPSLWPGDAFSIQILATLTPPFITGCYWPWLLTWGGGGGNQGVENHHGPAQTRHSGDLCRDSLHFIKLRMIITNPARRLKALWLGLSIFYLYKRLFPTAWGWFVVKFWSKDLSIFYKEILR